MRWKKLVVFMLITGGAVAIQSQPSRRYGEQAQAIQGEEKGKPKATYLTANELVKMAIMDLQTIPLIHQPFIRYLAIQDGEMLSVRTCSLTMNYLSRASTIIRPMPLFDSHLVRIDLRLYAPRQEDLAEWLTLWEELSFDPMFALLITKDTINFSGLRPEQLPKRKVKKTVIKKVKIPGKIREEKRVIDHPGGDLVYPDGRGTVENVKPGKYVMDLRFDEGGSERDVAEQVEVEVVGLGEGVDVVRLDGGHIDPAAFQQLQTLTGSLAPIVDHNYFKARALSTIRDKGVFTTIWGGLYYEFRGIKKSKDVKGKEKVTDLDVFFEGLGIGNIKGGETAEQLFDRLRSDQRLAVFRSNVTGKPRDVSMFHTPAEREGSSWGAITGDVKDQSVDIGDRAYANLLNPRRDAREAIFPTANGFPIFALFNGQGVRQDEVPPDIANDDTIPPPYTRRLQPGIGCIRCHGPHDGWQPLQNDVAEMMKNRRFDIFDDLSSKSRFNTDIIDRLAGLYSGSFAKNLRRARDDFAEASLKATGPWPDGDLQVDLAKKASARLSSEYAEYNYELVDAQKACRELGHDLGKEEAVAFLKASLPPDPRSRIGDVFPEDPRLIALESGISILRTDWSLFRPFAAERLQRNLANVRKGAN